MKKNQKTFVTQFNDFYGKMRARSVARYAIFFVQ